MEHLEKLAKEAFEKFGQKALKRPVYWHFLSTERKLQWMKEIKEMSGFVLTKLRAELKPMGPTPKSMNSYGMGVQEGTRSERMRMAVLFDAIEEALQDEFDNFIKMCENQNR